MPGVIAPGASPLRAAGGPYSAERAVGSPYSVRIYFGMTTKVGTAGGVGDGNGHPGMEMQKRTFT